MSGPDWPLNPRSRVTRVSCGGSVVVVVGWLIILKRIIIVRQADLSEKLFCQFSLVKCVCVCLFDSSIEKPLSLGKTVRSPNGL